MSDSRNTNTLEAKVETSHSIILLKLNQSARNGEVLGIGACNKNPSGCYDIIKDFALGLHNVPFIRFLQCSNSSEHKFLDAPPKFTKPCQTVLFTGCGLKSHKMISILKSLAKQYQFTSVKYVYEIIMPHISCGIADQVWKRIEIEYKVLFEPSSYQFSLLTSGLDANSLSNIGIPRFKSNSSKFKISLECFGVIRYSHPINFDVSFKKYLNEFFRQVANAGKDSINKPIMVIAIGITSTYSQENILEVAKKHLINIDFCNQYSNNRLPQEDFFKALSAMQNKRGIISFDDISTQSLLQALSFGASVMIYSQNYTWARFYAHLVELVPIEYQPIAKVILGLSEDYELLKDGEKCQKAYEVWHLAVNDAHTKFDNFTTVSTLSTILQSSTLTIPTDQKSEDEKTSSMNSSSVACSSFSSSSQLNLFAISKREGIGSNAKTQLSRSLIPR